MTRGHFVKAIAVLGLLAGGCDGPRGEPTSLSAASVASDVASYRLSPGDKVKITVFNEPDMSGEFSVNDAGNVALPLAGEVPAAGATAQEFKGALARKLSGRYVKNPRVSVEVISYRPFNVVGEVRNAGQYPYRPGLTVQDAVAMAGGYTYRANTHTAYIRRAQAPGESTVKTDGERIAVLPGDNIRIPERYF
jgi:polysaccharide export outer membrane protein